MRKLMIKLDVRLLFALTLCALLLVSGCATDDKKVITGKAVKNDDTIKIGLMGAFSGNAAVFGNMMQNGWDLAFAELSDEYKSRIKIIKEDDMCSNTGKAITAATKLVYADRVNYVVGPLCNAAIIATENLFEDNKVISLTIGLPSNYIANMGPYHFSFSPEIEYLMKTISGEIIDQGITEVAVIYMSATFEAENRKHFVNHFTLAGGKIVSEQPATKGTTDFRVQVQKIKQSKPDAIMIVAHTAELVAVLKQLEESGLGDLPKFGIHAAESPSILKEAADIAEGLTYPFPADPRETPTTIAYKAKYRARYNVDPDPYSANVYDSLKLLVKAIDKCGQDNQDCIRQQLASTKNYPGANGLLSVDKRGIGTYKGIMLKTVKDGKFQKLAG